jgi:hypothetical protein
VTVVRIVLAAVGGALTIYGGVRLVHGLPPPVLLVLGGWLVAVVIIHHGVVSPLVLGVGAALRRWVPDRARGYLQAGLIMASAVTVIAVPLILREHTQPPAKAMLLQDYRQSLLALLLVIAVLTCIAYAIRVARDRAPSSDSSG